MRRGECSLLIILERLDASLVSNVLLKPIEPYVGQIIGNERVSESSCAQSNFECAGAVYLGESSINVFVLNN